MESFVKNKLTPVQKEKLNSVFEIIEGFESALALEILASVHFLLAKNKDLAKKELLEKI